MESTQALERLKAIEARLDRLDRILADDQLWMHIDEHNKLKDENTRLKDMLSDATERIIFKDMLKSDANQREAFQDLIKSDAKEREAFKALINELLGTVKAEKK